MRGQRCGRRSLLTRELMGDDVYGVVGSATSDGEGVESESN